MPIFNFKCRKCGKTFETLLKNSAEKALCPECGSGELEKLLNQVAVGRTGIKCASKGSCPAADSPSCGCGCGCGCGHHHH